MLVDDEKLDMIVHKVKNIQTYVHARQTLYKVFTHLEDELGKLYDNLTDMIAESDDLSKNIKRVSNV